ncbi:MAG: A24 family peptidase [Planctomycetota bacterium]
MDYSLWPTWVIVLAAIALTTAAAITDFRCRRIPNPLTLSAFVLGLIFRLSTDGIAGLLDAGLAFAVGFGTLFVLWIAGGGGAGDVKLMGALSVWIGFSLTVSVLVTSVVFVMLLTAAAPLFPKRSTVVASTARPGDMLDENPARDAEIESAAEQRVSEADAGLQTERQPAGETKGRLTVAYAIPLALATWLVLGLDCMGLTIPLL